MHLFLIDTPTFSLPAPIMHVHETEHVGAEWVDLSPMWIITELYGDAFRKPAGWSLKMIIYGSSTHAGSAEQ